MDEQQQQRVNQAAEEFANAMVESQRTMAERGISVQEMNAQLTQEFFNRTIDNLRRMTEETRGASQDLAEQTQRAQEAARTLTQETTGVYMEFMNSLFALSQAAVQWRAERGTREVQRTSTTEAPAERQAGAQQLPLEDYDSLTVEQVSERLDDLSVEELRRLRAYEAENRNRTTLLRRLDERIEAGSPS